jgi:hypothetical protein
MEEVREMVLLNAGSPAKSWCLPCWAQQHRSEQVLDTTEQPTDAQQTNGKRERRSIQIDLADKSVVVGRTKFSLLGVPTPTIEYLALLGAEKVLRIAKDKDHKIAQIRGGWTGNRTRAKKTVDHDALRHAVAQTYRDEMHENGVLISSDEALSHVSKLSQETLEGLVKKNKAVKKNYDRLIGRKPARTSSAPRVSELLGAA